jgi:pimeloyl-ACP methyl ester carboxylesterase
MRDRFEAERRIAAVSCPLLALHGEQDRVIPVELGERLWAAAPGPKTWWPVPRAGHEALFEALGPEYLRRLTAFLAGLDPAAEPGD